MSCLLFSMVLIITLCLDFLNSAHARLLLYCHIGCLHFSKSRTVSLSEAAAVEGGGLYTVAPLVSAEGNSEKEGIHL